MCFDVCILSAPLGFFQEKLVSFDVKVLNQISVGFGFHGVASTVEAGVTYVYVLGCVTKPQVVCCKSSVTTMLLCWLVL